MVVSSSGRATLASVVMGLCLAGCGGEIGTTNPHREPDSGVLVGDVLDEFGCDPLTPYDCGFPFPSNVYLVDDASMVTGHHVEVPNGALIPYANNGAETDLTLLRECDGFSPGVEAVARIEGATSVGLADSVHIGDSLLADSPTVLVDATTGQRVAHWAELDERSQPSSAPPGDSDAFRRALLVRPAARLEANHRYIVAIRDVVDVDGHPIEPTPVFRALRDDTPSMLATVERRRQLYADIFARLEDVGVGRETLQLAWDFNTASEQNNTRRMLHMRDSSLAELGPAASPAYTITSIVDDPPNDAHVKRIIRGVMTVPMYLSSTVTGGTMTIGPDHLPVRQGSAQFPFTFVIPQSAATAPVPLMQFGHGLFGSNSDVLDRRVTLLADTYGFVALGFDWLGLSSADVEPLANLILGGKLEGIATIPDRGQQAVLNMVLGARMVTRGLVGDPSTFLGGNPSIDPSRVVFFGASLGGIYGSTFMAVTTDITRGATGVPGQSFDLLLPRSALFDEFLIGFAVNWDDKLRFPLFLNVAQMLWDRVDPTGYSNHLRRDPLPGTSVKEILMISALGDHLVSNHATHVMARSIGLPLLEPVVQPVYGVPQVTGPTTGGAWIEMDFGLPPVPVDNNPARVDPDTHDAPWGRPIVQSMIADFLMTGVIANHCSGACDPD